MCRWKHAATCHQGSTVDGEGDVFVDDHVYRAIACAHETGEEDAECDEDAEGESVHEDDLD